MTILFKSLCNFAISDDLKVQSRFGYYNHVEKRIVESAEDRRVRSVFPFIPQKEEQERSGKKTNSVKVPFCVLDYL